jgi:hypothetical protein
MPQGARHAFREEAGRRDGGADRPVRRRAGADQVGAAQAGLQHKLDEGDAKGWILRNLAASLTGPLWDTNRAGRREGGFGDRRTPQIHQLTR